jgi:hypothetical protein
VSPQVLPHKSKDTVCNLPLNRHPPSYGSQLHSPCRGLSDETTRRATRGVPSYRFRLHQPRQTSSMAPRRSMINRTQLPDQQKMLLLHKRKARKRFSSRSGGVRNQRQGKVGQISMPRGAYNSRLVACFIAMKVRLIQSSWQSAQTRKNGRLQRINESQRGCSFGISRHKDHWVRAIPR